MEFWAFECEKFRSAFEQCLAVERFVMRESLRAAGKSALHKRPVREEKLKVAKFDISFFGA